MKFAAAFLFSQQLFLVSSFSPRPGRRRKPKAARPAAAPSQEEMMKAWMAVGDARRGAQEAGADGRLLHGRDEDVDGSDEAPGGDAPARRRASGCSAAASWRSTWRARRWASRSTASGDRVRQLQEEVRRLVGGQHGDDAHDLDRHRDASGKKFTFWSTMDDVVMKKPIKVKGIADGRGRRPPHLRDVGARARRQDVQVPGSPVHAEEVAQSFFSASIAFFSDCRLRKNLAHGSVFRSRSA